MIAMEFEPWMLLVFPLFFGMGWLAARFDLKKLLSESSALPQSYFQGLNFLLNEQPDQAIESFIEVVQVDPHTIELHFALGSLFRRRGEIDRALRMHHNLVERADLDKERRQQAIFELGQDYLKAGILDRAEMLFGELKNTPYARPALEFLLELFQKEHDWAKAILIAQQLGEVTNDVLYRQQAAHFCCELALEDMAADDLAAARAHLQQALQECPGSVRTNLLLGDLNLREQHIDQAISTWQQVEQQNPDYLPLVAERLLTAYRSLGQESQGIALLRRYLDNYHAVDLMNLLFDALLQQEGPAVAYQLVRNELERKPTLIGLNKLLEARLLEVPLDRRADVELVKNIIHQRTRSLAAYQCGECGFKARQFYWHCPACQAWDSFPPRRSEETGQAL